MKATERPEQENIHDLPPPVEEPLIGPPIPPWPQPEPPPQTPPSPRELTRMRLRLLLLAGIAGPAGMVVIGAAFAWFVRDEVLWEPLTRFENPLWIMVGALLSAGASIGLIGLMYRANKRFARALRRTGGQVAEDTLKAAGYPVMVAVVAAAGFGEELLFRAGLQPTLGVIPAAVLFGFSHGGWRREMWAYAIAATGAGLVFGLAYHLTGDIWIPIIGHALHNVISVFAIGRKFDISFKKGRLRVRWVKETEDEEAE